MSYTEVINEETLKFIQKSTELILQFRDFDKHPYKMQYGEDLNTQQANKEKYYNQDEGNNKYDSDFQLINQTFFEFIRKHAQSFQNWTIPEQKELTIEIFGQNRIAQLNQANNQLSSFNLNSQQNQNPQFGFGRTDIQQTKQSLNQQQQNYSHKMEEWKFVFRHLNNEEESSNQIQKLMNPQQFVMNLSILTRSILSMLTNMPVFKCRDYLKISRRVHFTKGTVNEFNLNFQQVPLKIETYTKKIYLLHHVFELQIKYLIDQNNDIPAKSESPRFADDKQKIIPQLTNNLSSFSIYSRIDDSSSQQSAIQNAAFEMSKLNSQMSNVQKSDIQSQQKEHLKTSNITNQSIFDMDFSSISSVSPRNTYSPQNAAVNKAPKKYSEDLTLFKKNFQENSPKLHSEFKEGIALNRDKSNTVQQALEIKNEQSIGRRHTEFEDQKDQLQEQLNSLLEKLNQLGDPYIEKKENRSVKDVLQSIQA